MRFFEQFFEVMFRDPVGKPLAEITASIHRLHLKQNQLWSELMVTKAEVLAAIEALKAATAEEKTEVLAAIASAVAAAVAPLETVIADLRAQIEAGVDLSDILTAVEDVSADVESIVEAAAPEPTPTPDEPTAEI